MYINEYIDASKQQISHTYTDPQPASMQNVEIFKDIHFVHTQKYLLTQHAVKISKNNHRETVSWNLHSDWCMQVQSRK